MTSQEAFRSEPEGRSRRTVRRIEQELQREWQEKEDLERSVSIAEFLLKLEEVKSNPSLSSALEIVYPKSRLGRVISPNKDRMIIATTSYVSGISTLGGWGVFRNVTARYLQIEQTEGYVLPSVNDENPHFMFDDVVLKDGRVGTLLKPEEGQRGGYSNGEDSVQLYYFKDVFEDRNCQAVWGPSLTSATELSIYQARQATQHLGRLIVGS